jgi:hypothetical protein
MASITIGVNKSESSNRIRFQTLSQRLQNVNVDILHKAPQQVSLDPKILLPDSGQMGCFFLDELEQCKKLETALHFQRFGMPGKVLYKSSVTQCIHFGVVLIDLDFTGK